MNLWFPSRTSTSSGELQSSLTWPNRCGPNGVRLSPDEKTLYVTNGGSNSIAVVQLRQNAASASQVIGLIPTGWYPNSVSVSKDGTMLYAVNGKRSAGPNPSQAQARRRRMTAGAQL